MPSFDVVNKIDHQNLDNAINTARKEITTRYDFHDSKTTIEFDKKALEITVVTENDMRMRHVQDVIVSRSMKQGIAPEALDFGKDVYASGNMVRKEIKIKEGIDKETAKKITKDIKASGLKVQPSIMEDQVRVTGKKIDDLQEVIAFLKSKQGDYGLPLQFVNMKS